MWLHVPLLELICMCMEGGKIRLAVGAAAGVCDWISMWDALFCGILIIWFFFEGVCACLPLCEHVLYVCLHGLCVCIIVFSARLAVPVCACVQVAHDPGSAGRSVSFMSPVQFSLKYGSKDKRITPICCDTHTHTHETHQSLWKMTSWRFEW